VQDLGRENLRWKFRWRRDIFIWEEQLEQEMYTSYRLFNGIGIIGTGGYGLRMAKRCIQLGSGTML